MSDVIAFTNDQGAVTVIYPSPGASIEFLLGIVVPPGKSAVVIAAAGLPTADNDFFDAWRLRADATVTVDLPAAREVWRGKLRAARAPILDRLDIAWMRAMAAGDSDGAAAIEVQRQALRDVTADPAIDAAQSPADLRAFWPDILAA